MGIVDLPNFGNGRQFVGVKAKRSIGVGQSAWLLKTTTTTLMALDRALFKRLFGNAQK